MCDTIRYGSDDNLTDTTFRSIYFTDSKYPAVLFNEKSIYLLVSSNTVSAGELVAYKIKQFEPKAIIVGEQSAGQVNSHDGARETRYFSAVIPSGTMSDESNGNFNLQGIGVTPDIVTSSDSAFPIAYKLALKESVTKPTGRTKYFRQQKTANCSPEGIDLTEFTGNFRKALIFKNNGCLMMIYDNMEEPIFLHPNGTFYSNRFPEIKFTKKEEKVTAIVIQHEDGYNEQFRKISEVNSVSNE